MKKVIESLSSQMKVLVQAQTTDQKTTMILSIELDGQHWGFSWDTLVSRFDLGNFSRCGDVVEKWISNDPKRRRFERLYCTASVDCYTEPQIERAYQALLVLWEAIKIAAATPSPKAIVAKNKLEELGFK